VIGLSSPLSHTEWRKTKLQLYRGQHRTTQHQNWTIFIWYVHTKIVWTLHWYCIVHWY